MSRGQALREVVDVADEKPVDVVALDLLARLADEMDPNSKDREAAAEKVFDDLVALDGHFGFAVQRQSDRISATRQDLVQIVFQAGYASTGAVVRRPKRQSNTFLVKNSQVGGDPTEVPLDYDAVRKRFRSSKPIPAHLLEPGAPIQYRSAAADIIETVTSVLRLGSD